MAQQRAALAAQDAEFKAAEDAKAAVEAAVEEVGWMEGKSRELVSGGGSNATWLQHGLERDVCEPRPWGLMAI